MHIFPQLVKSMHIFPPFDLKYTKLHRLNIFRLRRAHPLIIIHFCWGKNINQEGGGMSKKFCTILIYTPEELLIS